MWCYESLCAPQYNAAIISITNPTCCTHTPPVELPSAANNQTLFLVLLDSVTKQPFELNLSVVHTTFTGTYKNFLNRTGGTWFRFLEEERALSFLNHVQVRAHSHPLPSNGYQFFLSSEKKLQWRKAEHFSPFNFEVKNVWICISTLFDVLKMRCRIKHTNAAVRCGNDF